MAGIDTRPATSPGPESPSRGGRRRTRTGMLGTVTRLSLSLGDEMDRKGSARWEGDLKQGSGSSRSAPARCRARIHSPRGSATRRGPIPEELIGAAHAACFSMAFAAGLSKAGLCPNQRRNDGDGPPRAGERAIRDRRHRSLLPRGCRKHLGRTPQVDGPKTPRRIVRCVESACRRTDRVDARLTRHSAARTLFLKGHGYNSEAIAICAGLPGGIDGCSLFRDCCRISRSSRRSPRVAAAPIPSRSRPRDRSPSSAIRALRPGR